MQLKQLQSIEKESMLSDSFCKRFLLKLFCPEILEEQYKKLSYTLHVDFPIYFFIIF